jgi:hypothetical protein
MPAIAPEAPNAGTIERQIAAMPQPILDGRTEQPQRPHVQDQMEPSSMQKHHGEEREKIRDRKIGLAGCKGLGVAGGDQREFAYECLKLVGAEAVLEQKHQAVGGDQHPSDHRWVTGRDGVPYRDHLRLFESMVGDAGRFLALSAWGMRIMPSL